MLRVKLIRAAEPETKYDYGFVVIFLVGFSINTLAIVAYLMWSGEVCGPS